MHQFGADQGLRSRGPMASSTLTDRTKNAASPRRNVAPPRRRCYDLNSNVATEPPPHPDGNTLQMRYRNAVPAAFAILGIVCAGPLAGQTNRAWNPQSLQMERSELVELLEQFEAVAQSPGYSQAVRSSAERDAGIIQERLERGDFGVGDRIQLDVEGEPDLSDSFLVEPGPRITLPLVGSISLQGVLRSELEEHLNDELSRFLVTPVVRAESLIRLGVLGSVGAPGFFTVPADMLLGDVLMHAGGPTPEADMESMRIERAGQPLWQGAEFQQALAEGWTLDQLNVVAGDQIVVQSQVRGETSVWRTLLISALTIGTTVLFGVRAF